MWQCLRRVNSAPFVWLCAPFRGSEYLPIAFHTTCNSIGDLWGLWVYLDKMHEKLAVNARKICDRFGTVIGKQWWWLLRERPQSWMAWTPWIYRTLTSQQVPSQPICVTTYVRHVTTVQQIVEFTGGFERHLTACVKRKKYLQTNLLNTWNLWCGTKEKNGIISFKPISK